MAKRGLQKDQTIWNILQKEENSTLFKGSQSRLDNVFSIVKKYTKNHGDTFELGSGNGYLSIKLLKSGYKVNVQDLSSVGLKNIANISDKKVKTYLGDDSGKLLASDNSIDTFIASEVLEHMGDANLRTCVTEIHRILKPNGVAVVTFPSNENLLNAMCVCPDCASVFHKVGHKQSWTFKKIHSVFSKFQILQIIERYYIQPMDGSFEQFAAGVMFILREIALKVFRLRSSDPTYVVILKKS